MTKIPLTTSVVSYAYTLMAGASVIGTLQGFNPSSNRTLERVRQLMAETQDILEIVPGRTESTISIDRIETYTDTAMEALGFGPEDTLDMIEVPFNIVETIISPTGKKRTVIYEDCWVNSVAKTVREGTITVSESITLWPTKIKISRQ